MFPGRAAVCIPRPDLPRPVAAGASDPWNDVGHKISVDPVDNAGINISHLEQRRSLGVPGTTIDPNHICHAPGSIRVSHDHGHSRLDMQKDRIRLGCRNAIPMIDRHTPCASTEVLAREGQPLLSSHRRLAGSRARPGHGPGMRTRHFCAYCPEGVQRTPRGPFFFLQYPAPMFTQPDKQALPLVGATS